MGENATEGIFIAAYIFIFIVALSATIAMFYMINNYAELSYEYGKNIENSGTLIENVPTSTYRLTSGSEVISYYFNYIKSNSGTNYKYKIAVLDEKGNDVFPKDKNGYTKKMDYNELLAYIIPSDIYYLTYDSTEEDEKGNIKINITIKKADENVLNQINV